MNQQALVEQLLDVCLRAERGERVWIDSWDHTLALASTLSRECRLRGCETITTVREEDLWLRSIVERPLHLVDKLPDQMAALLEKTDVYIYTLGPKRPIPWKTIPKERRKLVTRWFLEDNNFVKTWKKIAQRNRIRMLGIEATLATPETAKALGLNYRKWKSVMFNGCMANYREIAQRARRVAKLLRGKSLVHVTTPYGTDFQFRLDARPVDEGYGLADDRTVKSGRVVFVPAGGVEVSADETSGQGKIVFDAPILSLVKEGRIEKLTLEIEDGRILKHSAAYNSKAFGRWLREGNGDNDRFGFFGLGLNPRLRHGYTQDDKVLGGVTIGFGDNLDKAGKNRANGRNFWASMSKAGVSIDEDPVLNNGKLLV